MRSARASSSVEKYSFKYACAPPLRRALSFPEPCPITSCIAVSRSSASPPYRRARCTSPADEANSSIIFAEAAERAWLLPRNRKFFVPYFSWISFSFGRLSPIVVTWKSPVSMRTSTAFTTGG